MHLTTSPWPTPAASPPTCSWGAARTTSKKPWLHKTPARPTSTSAPSRHPDQIRFLAPSDPMTTSARTSILHLHGRHQSANLAGRPRGTPHRRRYRRHRRKTSGRRRTCAASTTAPQLIRQRNRMITPRDCIRLASGPTSVQCRQSAWWLLWKRLGITNCLIQTRLPHSPGKRQGWERGVPAHQAAKPPSIFISNG